MSQKSLSRDLQNLEALATAPVGRLLLSYSIPAIAGMVVTSLYNVIDRIFIGRGVGADAIAGLSITFPVMNLSAAIGVLIGAGAAARTSIMLGANDSKKAAEVLGNALVLTVANAIIYLSFFAYFLDDILILFGASPATLPYAHDFMLYILPGMLVMNLCFSFNNIMRASGYPVKAMYTMFIGAALNTILAPIFIFALDMGIRGAAIATDISMAVSAAFVMAHFIRKKSNVHFTRGIYRLRRHIVWQIVSIGAAPSLVNMASCFINAIINRSLLRYGSDIAVGAAGIFTTYTSLLVTVVLGLCFGLQPIVGYNYGAGLLHRLKRVVWIAIGVSTVICVLGSVLGLTVPHLIAMAFTVDGELIQVTSQAFKTALWAFSFVGLQIVATTFFQSIGQAWKSILLSLSRQVIIIIPLMLILPPILGLTGVWISFPISDLGATAISLALLLWQLKHLKNSNLQGT